MDKESDWVADVRRWYRASAQAGPAGSAQAEETESAALGYEAAHPALQLRHWPDALGGEPTEPK